MWGGIQHNNSLDIDEIQKKKKEKKKKKRMKQAIIKNKKLTGTGRLSCYATLDPNLF